jgi:hypothetical protein
MSDFLMVLLLVRWWNQKYGTIVHILVKVARVDKKFRAPSGPARPCGVISFSRAPWFPRRDGFPPRLTTHQLYLARRRFLEPDRPQSCAGFGGNQEKRVVCTNCDFKWNGLRNFADKKSVGGGPAWYAAATADQGSGVQSRKVRGPAVTAPVGFLGSSGNTVGTGLGFARPSAGCGRKAFSGQGHFVQFESGYA